MATATDRPATDIDDDPAPSGDVLFEVINGILVECPPMGSFEGVMASRLDQLLGPFAKANGLGRVVTEVLFRIDQERKLSRRPDVAFVSAGRWPLNRRVPRMNAWAVVPDLAVEIVSPSNRAEEVAEKVRDYFACGVRLVWVIYPGIEAVYVHASPTSIRVLNRAEDLEGEDVVPGFRLPLAELFGDEEAE